MPNQPTGTVTFFFSDIEGSTRLWEADPESMRVALARHDELLRGSIVANGGFVFKTLGDSFFAAFDDGQGALSAALEAQLALHGEPWAEATPIRVRMALHTGTADERDRDYVGPALNHCARLVDVAHGGQCLLSEASRDRVRRGLPQGVSLKDLGAHRLRDLRQPERIYQLVHPELPSEFPPLRSLDALPNNLPIRRSSFIGRGREMAEVEELLSSTAMLTLTGPGGTGKTRLALQVAGVVAGRHADGVWFVDLAPQSDPDLVRQSVASALGLHDEPGRSPGETLVDYLRPRNVLLLLDNCEHLVQACAELAQELLATCPHLQILATSREPLRIEGEMTWPVPGLALPDTGRLAGTGSGAVAETVRYEAVRLFAARAAAASPGFTVSEENAVAVAEVCRRLDGLPLAIELAAARVGVMSVSEILARLEDRFKLLTGGPRTAMPHQRTLRALIDWSYDLLPEQEQAVFRRLSVFRGGWTIEAAEAVCASGEVAPSDVLGFLSNLVSKSLVKVYDRAGAPRHGLLRTVEKYAWEKLAESGQMDAVRDRHLAYFLDLSEQAEPEMIGPNQVAWMTRLTLDRFNLRAALAWALEPRVGQERPAAVTDEMLVVERALRLSGALLPFWERRGYLAEGREWLSRALSLPGAGAPTGFRAKGLAGAGLLAWVQGDYAEAVTLSEESLAIAQSLDDTSGVAAALFNLATVRQHTGDFTGARAQYEEVLVLQMEQGDRQAVAGVLNNLGTLAWEQGNYVDAAAHFEESLALRRDLGDRRGEALSLNSLATIAYSRRDYATARALYEVGLLIVKEQGDRRGVAYMLNNLGRVAYEQGDGGTAAQLLAESLALKRGMGDRRGVANSLLNLGEVVRTRGDDAAARDLFRESLEMRRELGDIAGIAESLAAFAALAGAHGDASRATRLFGAAAGLRKSIGAAPLPSSRSERPELLDALRAALGEESFRADWEAGWAMSAEEACAYALSDDLPEPR